MIIGFTGTREGLTGQQIITLNKQLHILRAEIPEINCHFIHGGAEGADKQFNNLIQFPYYIEIYPCTKDRAKYWLYKSADAWLELQDKEDFEYQMKRRAMTVWPVRAPLERNDKIVERCDILLACPFEYEERPRGGTWYTIRRAREQKRRHIIIYPDGSEYEVTYDKGLILS